MIISRMQSLLPPPSTNLWLIRLLTFALAALAAASAAYWALKWPGASTPLRSSISAPQIQPIDSAKIAQLLGARQGAPGDAAPVASAQSNYKLQGVIALGGPGKSTASGSALIAVQGAPAKPYRVGDSVAEGLVLQSVKARSVGLGPSLQDAATLTLELPPVPGLP